MTGIPIYNVNNNCSTGSTALLLAKQLIESGNNDCVLALGFEKMERGSLMSKVFFLFLTKILTILPEIKLGNWILVNVFIILE